MAFLPPPQLFHLMGFGATGDLGPYTFYTNKNGRLVFFLKAPPTEPPTYHQIKTRNAFRAAGYAWRIMNPVRREAWLATQARAHLCITGYNLWVFWIVTGDRSIIETIERQTGLDLLVD